MTDGGKPLLKSQGSHARYDMAPNTENQKRKRVLVVGAGAAGTYRMFTKHDSRQLLTSKQA
jgi:spermidine synthase